MATGKETFPLVVLGGGNAAGYCAKQFVESGGSAGDLCIIGREPFCSYERPALSKAYLFPDKPARLPGFHTSVGGGGERQEPAWYKDKGIAFKLGSAVTEASLKDKTLTLADGSSVGFEKLIIGETRDDQRSLNSCYSPSLGPVRIRKKKLTSSLCVCFFSLSFSSSHGRAACVPP